MVRIAAMNSEGYGAVATTSPANEIPRTVPSKVSSIVGTSMSKSVIKVTCHLLTTGSIAAGLL